jgi:hypothetical protein
VGRVGGEGAGTIATPRCGGLFLLVSDLARPRVTRHDGVMQERSRRLLSLGRSLVIACVLAGCATQGGGRAPASAMPSPRSKSDADDPDRAYYLQARTALDRKDATAAKAIDWRRFRRGSLLAGNALDWELSRKLREALESNDPARILAAARDALKIDAAYTRAHVIASNILREQGQVAESDLHGVFIKGILDSIVAAGDGRSFDTAFTVFHVHEEYDLTNAAGLKVVSQALQMHGGHAYDVLTVERARSPDGKTRDMFFEISEILSREGPPGAAGGL